MLAPELFEDRFGIEWNGRSKARHIQAAELGFDQGTGLEPMRYVLLRVHLNERTDVNTGVILKASASLGHGLIGRQYFQHDHR